MNKPKPFEVDTYIEFDNNVERFIRKKRFFKLPSQVAELKAKLEAGDFDEPPIFHTDKPVPLDVFKVRLPNKDTNEGKRGGYRVIYAVSTVDTLVIVLAVYYKHEQENMAENYIMGLIEGYFLKTELDDGAIHGDL